MDAVRELGSWPPLNADNIHAFRLKVKELRYVLQLSADADSGMMAALSDVQRRVGDWHDWQQLHEIASEILTPERNLASYLLSGKSGATVFPNVLLITAANDAYHAAIAVATPK